MSDADCLEFVSVSTPGGSKMTLAPFSDSSAKKMKKKQAKRKADELDSPHSSSSATSPNPTSPKMGVQNQSWSKNLERRGGFWGDAYWYDLHLEKRLPLAKEMLQQLVQALPPCSNQQVLDLCAGSGRASGAVLKAYPTSKFILVDSSEERLKMAQERLADIRPETLKTAKFITKTVTPEETLEFVTEPVDLVIASLAFHVLTERPVHYAQEEEKKKNSVENMYEQLFRAAWRSLRPGGHLVFADHVGQLTLFKQLKALEKVGFQDVDCAWRQDDSFVAGGRKPLL